jgi:phosphohistidine phosphatase SixA
MAVVVGIDEARTGRVTGAVERALQRDHARPLDPARRARSDALCASIDSARRYLSKLVISNARRTSGDAAAVALRVPVLRDLAPGRQVRYSKL